MATKTKTNGAIRFAFLNETKGALRFEEIGTDGKPVPMDKARVGSLYFRKGRFGELSEDYASKGKAPAIVSVTVECADE